MKRDKLYTINKWNKNLFPDGGPMAQKDWSFVPGTYDIAASTLSSLSAAPDLTGVDLTKMSVPAAPEINNSWLGVSKASNPFSKQNVGGTLTAAAPIVGGAVGGLLSNGMSTGVGNIMGGLGKAASAIPGPYGAAISAGLQIAGGAINGLFGEKVDQEKLTRNNAGTSYLNNFSSNAATFDAVQGPQTQLAVQNAYKGGIFNKSAKRKNAAARADRLAAQRNAFAQVENNVGNLVDSQMDNMLANYSAFGGALDIMQNDKYIDAINNRSNMLAKALSFTPSLATSNPNTFDVGGNLKMAFLDDFSKDPMGAVMNYNRGLEQMAADREARKNAAAQEELINGLQTGLQKAQTENEGLLAMYNSQQQALNALQNINAGLPATGNTAPYPITSEGGGDDLISGIANSGAKVVRDVMAGNNRGADDYRNLKEFIKKHESFVPKAYQLQGEAHPTIGYGFYDVYPGTNRKVKAGDTITKAEADKYLDAAIRNLDNILSPKVPNWNKMTNNQRDAIRDLAFGTGPWGAHFKPNSRLFQALRREDWAAAEKELRSKSASLDKYNKGLAKRSDRRQAMWRAGDYSVKAFGGELGTNVTDWTNGLLQINAGGSHEDNPLEGVPLGIDQNGVPNLVEEGETVFNDYVFSKRIEVPEEMMKDLGLGSIAKKKGKKKEGITFADASKKIAEESERRPNDPISKAGLETGLAKLAQVQEAERMRIQAEQDVKEAEAASLQSEPVVAACGGKINRFDTGGPKGKGKTYNKTANEKSILERLANSIGLGEITSSSGVQKVLNELGFDKATIRRMQSDLVNLGILPEGGENEEQIGVVPFANRGRAGRVGNIGRAANVAKREMAASRLASRGQMPKNTPKTGRPRIVTETSTPRTTVQQQVRGGDVPAGWRVGRGNVEGSIADVGRGTRMPLNVRPTVVGRGNVPSVLTPTPTAGAVATARGLLGATGALTGWGLYEALNGYQPKYTSEMTPYGGLQGVFEARNNQAATNNNQQTVADAEVQAPVAETADSAPTAASAPVTVETPTGTAVVNVPTTPTGTPVPVSTQTPETPYLYKEGAIEIPWDTQVETPQQRSPMEVIAENKGTTVTKNGTDFAPPSISTNSQGVIDSGEGTGIIDTESTDSADITEKQPKPYPTWMRYAPIVGTGIATMTDLLGLTNKPDYSYADKIEALAERAGYAPNIRAPYIGDYMRYTPFDRLFYANQLQANSRATDRGLMNTSGGNRGAAQAGMLANGYNSQLGLGNLYRQAEEYNRGQYERTKAFNRGTNQFNAQMGLEADMANARYRQMASQYQMQGLGQAAAMRQAEKARTDADRSLNITNFLNNLGNLGRENFAMNQINSDRAFGYGTRSNGNSYWKRDTRDTAAFGGELDKRNKKSNKRRRG